MKYFSKIVFSILIFFSFSISLYAQEEVSDEMENKQWAICVISGKDNKVGKIYKGPYETKELALANWIYNNIEPDKKYGITKHSAFVTKTPASYFKADYASVKADFDNNRKEAIEKYKIEINPKIEKKINSGIEAPKKEKKDKSKQRGLENPNETKLDETDSTYEMDNQVEETETQVDTVEEKVEVKEEQPQPVIEPEPIAEPVEEPVLPVTDFTSVLEELAKKPVQRYTKEYLQDYIITDEIPEPEDESSSLQLIENPNEADNFGQTLLMKAAKAGNEWQIKTLLNSGADINLKDKDGWTALMYAVRYQEGVSTIELLINHNADTKIKNNYDASALVLAACYNNNPQVLKKLLSYYSISDKEVLKSFVLLLSTNHTSEYVQIAKLNIYLDKSIPLNNFYDGKTPIMYAAQYGNSTKILKLLIENGATTNLRSTDGKTAFDYATQNNTLTHDESYWLLNRKQ